MWKWEYTDDSGRRRVSRWLMTEHEALRYKDANRVQHTLRVVFWPPVKGAVSHGNAAASGGLPFSF